MRHALAFVEAMIKAANSFVRVAVGEAGFLEIWQVYVSCFFDFVGLAKRRASPFPPPIRR